MQANEEEGRILYPISHDLKAPLNRIFGLTELVNFSRDKLSEEHKDYLDKIRQVTCDALDMIDNMIDAYDLEKGEFKERIEPVDVCEIISSRVQSYRYLAQLKNISIVFAEPDISPITIPTNALMVSRIVDNLLSNAIKFSYSNKKIYVNIENKPDTLQFSVRDQGPGIPEQERKLLYKKFQRIKINPTAGETTTSLGLYVVKTMLKKINGSIICKSQPRQGTTFTVTLNKKKT